MGLGGAEERSESLKGNSISMSILEYTVVECVVGGSWGLVVCFW